MVTTLLLLASSTLARTPGFWSLGDLPGGEFDSWAEGVSADGSVVVGHSRTASGTEAFRWTLADGMVGLGRLPGSADGTWAYGVSGDSTVVIGVDSANAYQSFRWTASEGMVTLNHPPGIPTSGARAASWDGSVIVGEGNLWGNRKAYRWSAGGGPMVDLGNLPGYPQIGAFGVSGDGRIVVGGSYQYPKGEAFYWTEQTGLVGLGDLPGGLSRSFAYAISSDGTVIVGQSDSASGPEAFRWTKEGGMQGLGDLPGGYFDSLAFDTSADGSVVVGTADSYGNAFIWEEGKGMRSVYSVLTQECGLQLPGWSLKRAYGVSDDGCVIVGVGVHAPGVYEAWLAVTPEPATLSLLALGGLLALHRRRK